LLLARVRAAALGGAGISNLWLDGYWLMPRAPIHLPLRTGICSSLWCGRRFGGRDVAPSVGCQQALCVRTLYYACCLAQA